MRPAAPGGGRSSSAARELPSSNEIASGSAGSTSKYCGPCALSHRRTSKRTLPTRYVHVVFTLPPQLAPLALQNKKVIYDLLSAPVRRHFSKSLAIPDTSARKLASSPCCTPGSEAGAPSPCPLRHSRGGLSPDHTHWVKSRDRFFLSIHVLRRIFRGKFVARSPAGLP